MTQGRIETRDDIAAGLTVLCEIDPRLRPVAAAAGEVPLRRRPGGYAGLASIIVAQMVSRASADAIWTRLCERTGFVTPVAYLALSETQVREVGLSRAKHAALAAAARACLDGALDLEGIETLPAGDAVAELTRLKGIGPWTAEVYLLFCAGHVDILPAGDIALQSAARHALGLEVRPDARRLRTIAEEWSPWRGVAARLLWAYYANVMGRDAAPVVRRRNLDENGP